MSAIASQITSLTIVYLTVYSGTDQRKHQSSASLAFVRGIHRWPVNSPHKGPVTRKIFPFDDVIMHCQCPLSTMSTVLNTSLKHLLKFGQSYEEASDCPSVSDRAFNTSRPEQNDRQTIFSYAFLWMKRFVFWLKFHGSLFLRVQLPINQHWFG